MRVCTFAVAFLILFTVAVSQDFSEYRGYNAVVDSVWVNSCLRESRLLDVTSFSGLSEEESYNEFLEGHLPYAVYVYPGKISNSTGVPGTLLGEQEFEILLSQLGIHQNDTIVLYDDNNNLYSTRLYFTFLYYSHEGPVKILDGGKTSWVKEGYPLTSGQSYNWDPSQYTVTWVQSQLVRSQEWVLEHYDDSGVVLIDSRSTDEYLGFTHGNPPTLYAGHITNAVHMDWSRMVDDDGQFLPLPQAAAMYESYGVTCDKTIVVYCHTAMRAAVHWVLLVQRGCTDVVVYDGSWAEWGNTAAGATAATTCLAGVDDGAIAPNCPNATQPYPPQPDPVQQFPQEPRGYITVINSEDLQEIVKYSNVSLLDVTGFGTGDNEQDQQLFDLRHVPHAKFVYDTELTDQSQPYPGAIASPVQFRSMCERLGVSPTDTVIIYDSDQNLRASRLFFIFRYYSHPGPVMLYDGGRYSWESFVFSGHGSWEKGRPTLTASVYQEPVIQEHLVKTREWVAANFDNPDVLLLDSRTRDEFLGFDRRATFAGHITNAVHLNWADMVGTDMHYINLDRAASHYDAMGITCDKTIVAYCQTAVRAATHAFLLWERGCRDVSIYDGSWAEWGNSEEGNSTKSTCLAGKEDGADAPNCPDESLPYPEYPAFPADTEYECISYYNDDDADPLDETRLAASLGPGLLIVPTVLLMVSHKAVVRVPRRIRRFFALVPWDADDEDDAGGYGVLRGNSFDKWKPTKPADYAPHVRYFSAILVLSPIMILCLCDKEQGGMLWLVGLFLGAIFHWTRYGFATPWRVFQLCGRGRLLRIQMFSMFLAAWWCQWTFDKSDSLTPYDDPLRPFLSRPGLSLAIGAFVFGIAMQVAGGCASGTCSRVGTGTPHAFIVFPFFIIGCTFGAWFYNEYQDLPDTDPYSFLDELGYGNALLLQASICVGVWGLCVLVEAYTYGIYNVEPITADPAQLVGGVLVAFLQAVIVILSGSPWGITSALTLWGSALYGHMGGSPQDWDYWGGFDPSDVNLFDHHSSVLVMAFIVGTAFASDLFVKLARLSLPGLFPISDEDSIGESLIPSAYLIVEEDHIEDYGYDQAECDLRHVPLSTSERAWSYGTAALAGFLMGLGARMAYGCNVGSYFSGVSSSSAHGWMWAACAFVGSFIGSHLRSVCLLAVEDSYVRTRRQSPNIALRTASVVLGLIVLCTFMVFGAVGSLGTTPSSFGVCTDGSGCHSAGDDPVPQPEAEY